MAVDEAFFTICRWSDKRRWDESRVADERGTVFALLAEDQVSDAAATTSELTADRQRAIASE